MYTRDRILCNVIYRNLSIVIYRSHLYGEHSISLGLNHFSISVGSKRKVDMLAEQLGFDEYKIVGEPRTTEDSYYESIIKNSESNWVEIKD